MKLYGIKSCGSVKKAMAYLKARDLAYEFVDLKNEHVDQATIQRWLEKVSLERLFNNKGTKYRTLGLSKEDLSDAQKITWLEKENLLIKRPVIELDNGDILVAYDEELYHTILGA